MKQQAGVSDYEVIRARTLDGPFVHLGIVKGAASGEEVLERVHRFHPADRPHLNEEGVMWNRTGYIVVPVRR